MINETIEQPNILSFEKVLSQNSLLSEKFLGVFKRLISNISVVPENSKNEVKQATQEYIQTSLQDLDINLPNIEKLTNFLISHIDSIQSIIAVCHDVKKKFEEAKGLKLIYEVETDDSSGAENITLYVAVDKKTIDLDRKLKSIVTPYIPYFIDSGILFTVQFDFHR